MRYRLRKVAVFLIASSLVASSLEIVRRAYGEPDSEFDRYVGWSNILALTVGSVGLAYYLLDRFLAPGEQIGQQQLEQVEDEIAHVLLKDETNERSRLLGTHRRGIDAIDVEYRQSLIRYRTAGGNEDGTLNTVLEYYHGLEPRRIVILGEPGSGKTVLATHLSVQLLERWIRESRQSEPIPFRMSLANFDTALSLDQWIIRQLIARFPRLDPKVARLLVERRRILPVLDGLDEMDDDTSVSRMINAVGRINTYFEGMSRAPVVVTSRASAYRRLEENVDSATVVEIQSLEAEQIVTYLRGKFRDLDDELAWIPVLEVLNERGGAFGVNISNALSTPWALILAYTSYRDGMNPSKLLELSQGPDHAREVKKYLLSKFVGATSRLTGEVGSTQYKDAEITEWLRTLARYLKFSSAGQHAGTDIVLHKIWPISGRFAVQIAHSLLGGLVVLAGLLAPILCIPDPKYSSLPRLFWFATHPRNIEPSFLVSTLIVIVSVLIVPPLAAWLAFTSEQKPYRFLVRNLKTGSGIQRLLFSVIAGTAAGTVIGLTLGASDGFAIGSTTGLIVGLGAGILAGVAFGIMHAANQDTIESVDPRGIVRADLTFGVLTGVSVGLVAGTAAGVVIGPVFGVAVAVSAVLVLGIGIGPSAGIRYGVAVILSALAGRLPLRLGRFLKWGVESGLLRTAGIAYQFRHRELQEWLTDHARNFDQETNP